MDRVMDHAEIQELLGAYALDAVDADETEQIERHLAECPKCRAEVAQYLEVAALLSHGAPAPSGVWDRIMAGLEERPPPLRLDRIHGAPLPPSPGGRKSVSLRVFTAVAAVAAVVVAALGIQVARLEDRTGRVPRVVADQALVNAYQAAATESGARHLLLRFTPNPQPVSAVVLPSGTGFLDARILPRLGRDRTYQLWGLGGALKVPISLAVMGAAPGIQQFGVPAGAGTLAVTDENAGGAVAPTSAPLAAGQLAG